MKTIYLVLIMLCTTATLTYAQDRGKGYFGVKAGSNFSNIYDTEDESFVADGKFGLAAGMFLTLPITDIIGIQPEVLFSQKGFKAKGMLFGNPYSITHTTNYLDIPLLIAIKPVSFVTILAGPQYSYLLGQSNKFENGQTTIEQEKEFDNQDLRKNTLCFTGGVDINLNQVVVGGRLGWDLYKNNGDGSTVTPRYKNTWYQLTLGYRF